MVKSAPGEAAPRSATTEGRTKGNVFLDAAGRVAALPALALLELVYAWGVVLRPKSPGPM